MDIALITWIKRFPIYVIGLIELLHFLDGLHVLGRAVR